MVHDRITQFAVLLLFQAFRLRKCSHSWSMIHSNRATKNNAGHSNGADTLVEVVEGYENPLSTHIYDGQFSSIPGKIGFASLFAVFFFNERDYLPSMTCEG